MSPYITDPLRSYGSPFKPAEEYRGHVLRVIDGDTLEVALDLGFCVTTTIHVRIQNLFAPEVHGVEKPLGAVAKGITEFLAKIGAPIVVTTTEVMSLSRYVGKVFLFDLSGERYELAERLCREYAGFFKATRSVRATQR